MQKDFRNLKVINQSTYLLYSIDTGIFNFYLDRVYMYVYEEIINGKKLTETINETHENVKYLSGHKLPENVFATSDIVEAAKDADILIFVLPHQYISQIGSQLCIQCLNCFN